MKSILVLILCSLFYQNAHAQAFRGQNEIAVSYGAFPIQETLNWEIFGGGSGGTSVNNTFANIFATYRYYISQRFAIGGAIGTGSFTVHSWDDGGQPLTNSDYKNYRTIAPEILVNFVNKKWIRAYSYIGAGYSFYTKSSTDYYGSGQYKSAAVASGSFNAHYTPIGLSVGDRLSAFIEVGIGYKGIFHGGLSYRFGKRKLLPYEKVQVNTGDVIVLSGNYPIDSSFKDLGSVKTILSGAVNHDYATNMEQALAKTKSRGGNVFIPAKCLEAGPDRYVRIKGRAFYAKDTDRIRGDVQSKYSSIAGQHYANLIIYCMDAHPQFKYYMQINDSSRKKLRCGNKYVFKINKEGTYRIWNGQRNSIFVDVKFGNDYYVKNYAREGKRHKPNRPAGKFVLMNAMQGELESATARNSFSFDLDAAKL